MARAHLAVASDPAVAEALAEEGLALCRGTREDYWTATALNLLSEIALQTGRADEAAARVDQALALAQAAGDGWNEGAIEQARQHLTRSIELSQATGTRIGIARGLEVFATLAVQEKQPERAVQLAAAAAALRESAGVAPLSSTRTETYLASARHLGESAVTRLWTQGLALSSEAAVALAVDVRRPRAAANGDIPVLTIVAEPDAT